MPLTRTLAGELVAKGIRVNAISPGPISTAPKQQKGFEAYMVEQNPMKRFGRPEEVAKAVLFIGSSEASFTTGAELTVDGGLNNL